MMPTLFSGTGSPVMAGTQRSDLTPLLAPAPQPGTLACSQVPTAMPSLPAVEVAAPPAPDDTEQTVKDADPEQLLALLLTVPVSLPPEQHNPPVQVPDPVSVGNGAQAVDVSRVRVETENAGVLRNSILAAGRFPLSAPLPQTAPTDNAPPAAQRQASDVSPSMLQNGPDLLPSILQKAPRKLVTPADALLASQSVQQVLKADREPLTSDSTLQHPAPALVNALLKGDAATRSSPPVVLPAAPEEQAETLKNALAERLEIQIDRRVQKATIRLDPPNLGKMDISIHFESGKLQVQIQAVQPEISRLLHQISNEMRASLSEQHNVQVNVQVSTHTGGDSRQQPRHRDRPEPAIANNNEEVTTMQRGTDGTILTMA